MSILPELNAELHAPLEPWGQLERWAAEYQAGSRKAADLICRRCTKLVASRVRKWHKRGGRLDADDMMSVGYQGVLDAAAKYRPDKGTLFITYCTLWVDARLRACVVRDWSLLKMGTTQEQRLDFFTARTEETRRRKAGELSSTSKEGYQYDCASPSPTPEAAYSLEEGQHRAQARVQRALASLPPRWVAIVQARLLGEERETLESVGARLGISKERVRQLERRGVVRLAKRLGATADEHTLHQRLRAEYMSPTTELLRLNKEKSA